MYGIAINKLIDIMLQHCHKVYATLAEEIVFSADNTPDAQALYEKPYSILFKAYDEEGSSLGEICIDLYPNNRFELIIDHDNSWFNDTVIKEYDEWCKNKTKE